MKKDHSIRRLRRANLFALAILGIGCLQMLGYLTGAKTLRGAGAASAASPFPKVFCVAPVHGEPGVGLETFSSSFTLLYDLNGEPREMAITPEIYARVHGPYNRRNVYGAALAYGPCLTPELVQQTLGFALDKPGRMIKEIGVPDGATNFRVRITGMANGEQRSWLIQPEREEP